MKTAAERFQKAYKLGYKDGVASVPPIIQMQSASTVAPIVSPRPPQMAELIQKRFQDAAKFSQRPLNLHSDLQTPLAVAGAGGALVSVVSFVVIGGGVALFVFEPSLKTYATIGWVSAVAGLGVTAWNWFGNSKLRMMATYSLENIFNVDIDGDGHTGKPLANAGVPLGKQSYLINHKRSADVDLDITKEQAVRIYNHLKKTDWKFSRRSLKGIVSQDDYPTLHYWMKYYELIGDKSTGQLSDHGKGFWKAVADYAASPTPPPHR